MRLVTLQEGAAHGSTQVRNSYRWILKYVFYLVTWNELVSIDTRGCISRRLYFCYLLWMKGTEDDFVPVQSCACLDQLQVQDTAFDCRSSQGSWRWRKSLSVRLHRAASAALLVVVNLAGFPPFRCPTAFCTARSRGPRPSDSKWHRRKVLGFRAGGHGERDGHAAIFYRYANVQKPWLITVVINHQWLIGTKGTKLPPYQWEGCLRGKYW